MSSAASRRTAALKSVCAARGARSIREFARVEQILETGASICHRALAILKGPPTP